MNDQQIQVLLQRLAVLEARQAQMEQNALAAPLVPPAPAVAPNAAPAGALPAHPHRDNPFLQQRLEAERRAAEEAALAPTGERDDRQELVTENARRKAAECKIRMADTPEEHRQLMQAEMERRHQWARDRARQQQPPREPPAPAEPPEPPKPADPPAMAPVAQAPPAQAPLQQPARPMVRPKPDIPTVDETNQTGPSKPGGAVPAGPNTNDGEPMRSLGKNMVDFANQVTGTIESMAGQLRDLSRRLETLEAVREMETHE